MSRALPQLGANDSTNRAFLPITWVARSPPVNGRVSLYRSVLAPMLRPLRILAYALVVSCLAGSAADAAITINGLVRWTINRGYAGLEAWAGTPGTVGGAIYGNAHWKKINIGDLVESVRLLKPDGTLLQAPADRMEFDYDYSRLKRTREVVLWAAFRVTPGGDPAALRLVARESLAFRKRTQPLEKSSAGCIFQNPDPAVDRVPEGIPWSAGALVDRAGLKGAREGAARVSPTHGNFIVNEGGASAADIRRLIERCRDAVRTQFGVELRDEIVCLGEF